MSDRIAVWEAQKPFWQGKEGKFAHIVGVLREGDKTRLLPLYEINLDVEWFALLEDGTTTSLSIWTGKPVSWRMATDSIFASDKDPWNVIQEQKADLYSKIQRDYQAKAPTIDGEVCLFADMLLQVGSRTHPLFRCGNGLLYVGIRIRRRGEISIAGYQPVSVEDYSRLITLTDFVSSLEV